MMKAGKYQSEVNTQIYDPGRLSPFRDKEYERDEFLNRTDLSGKNTYQEFSIVVANT